MRRRDLAGGATGTGADHDPVKVERDQRGFGRNPRQGEAGSAAQARRLGRENHRLGNGALQLALEAAPDMRDAGAFAFAIAQAARRGAEAGDAGKIFRARAQAFLLAAAHDLGRQRRAIAHDQRAGALRPAQLVARQGHVIAQRSVEIDLARRRHRIDQQQGAGLANKARDFGNRLDHAGLVVGRHHRDQGAALAFAQHHPQRFGIDHAFGGDRQDVPSRRPALRSASLAAAARIELCSMAETNSRVMRAPCLASFDARLPRRPPAPDCWPRWRRW